MNSKGKTSKFTEENPTDEGGRGSSQSDEDYCLQQQDNSTSCGTMRNQLLFCDIAAPNAQLSLT